MTTPTTERPAAGAERSLPRLQQRYREEIVPALREEFTIGNVMQTLSLVKIVVNMGVGEAARDSKLIEGAVRDLATITGQKPVVTRAHQIHRAVQAAGGHDDRGPRHPAGSEDVGVRRPLLTLALPRIRDFRGLSPKQFDGNGNYTFGLNEQGVFHEINQDRIDLIPGMDITFVTTATNDDEGRALLRHLGFPFRAN